MKPLPAILLDCDIRAMEGIIAPLGRRGIPIIGLSTKHDCPAFHSRYLRRRVTSPAAADEEAFISFLSRLEDRGVLYPSDDLTTVVLARQQRRLEGVGFRLNVPPEEVLQVGFDKWRCHQESERLGIPVPATRLIEGPDALEEAAATVGYPLIIKGTTLAGGVYRRVQEPAGLRQALGWMCRVVDDPVNRGRRARLIVQEWLDYEMEDIWSVETVYRKDGRPVGFFSVRTIRTVVFPDGTYGSRVYAGESVDNPVFEAITERLLTRLGWRGFAKVDWVYSRRNDRYYLTEINPRLPGFSALPWKARFDMAYYYYADLMGLPIDPPRPRHVFYFELLRYPGDLSSALSTIVRGQYSVGQLLRSYARAITGRKPVAIDYLDWRDLGMTLANLRSIVWTLLAELRELLVPGATLCRGLASACRRRFQK